MDMFRVPSLALTPYQAEDLIPRLQQFVKDARMLKAEDIVHGVRLTTRDDEPRVVLGTKDAYYVLDDEWRIQMGAHGPVSAQVIAAYGGYLKAV